jgi:hypothetical protein
MLVKLKQLGLAVTVHKSPIAKEDLIYYRWPNFFEVFLIFFYFWNFKWLWTKHTRCKIEDFVTGTWTIKNVY